MDDSRLTNINQIKEFLKASQGVALSLKESGIDEKYDFIDQTIDRLEYSKLSRKGKRVVASYLKKVTGYKRAQLFRLINRAKSGKLIRKKYKRHNPNRKYSSFDIKLLEKTDELHLRLNTFATKEILRREHEVFHKEDYEKISRISPSHINNLRNHPIYRNNYVNHTKSTIVPIGETKKPENNEIPGSIRVDSVHQRDVYYINLVDEITQWEIVISVPQLTKEYLLPALKYILDQCPFVVFNFHSDRGSEFINCEVAEILNELLIHQTKSRSRHTNDNALVESKNGSVVRKNLGYGYFSKQIVTELNEWLKNYFNIYLNYHRPCLYQTGIRIYPNGREMPKYGQTTVPYEKLKEVSKEKKRNFLKEEVTFEELDKIAYQHSDNEFAKLMRDAESRLFSSVIKTVNQKQGSHRSPRP